MLETASLGRRVVALLIDWIACLLVVAAIPGTGEYGSASYGFWTLLVFVIESAFFTAVAGGSFGKLLARLRVIRADGSAKPIELLPALLRQVLVALVIPAVVFRPEDHRGLHDLAVGSQTVRLEDLRPELRHGG